MPRKFGPVIHPPSRETVSIRISSACHQVGGAAAICLSALACSAPERARSDRETGQATLFASLASTGTLPAPWAARFSIPLSRRHCDEQDALDPARLSCTSTDREKIAVRLANLAARAATALHAEVDPDALHTAALIDLIAGDTAGNSLDRSISYLEMVTRLDSTDASAFADLSAAHLGRAASRSVAKDLLMALDVASRALEADSSSLAARYNRALSLDLLGLDSEAARAWKRYVDLDARSEWSTVARRRLAITSARRASVRPSAAAPPESLAAFVDRDPYDARMFAWESLLGGWGKAVASGDTALARLRLAGAQAMADTIAARFGDSSLVHAVRAIHAVTPGSRASRRLAEAHVRYATARESTVVDNHGSAAVGYADAMAGAEASPVLRAWADLAEANALIYMRRPDEAARRTRALLDRLDQAAHPSLAGRAYWMLAVLQFRAGRDSAAQELNARAAGMFRRAGERDNHAATISLVGEYALRIGDDAGFSSVVQSLQQLRDFPTGLWRHNGLFILGSNAARLGLERAAAAIDDEDAASAVGRRKVSAAEARLIRARGLWISGDTGAAQAATEVATRAIAALPDEEARRQLHAELSLTLASGPLRRDPARALAMLDSVVSHFSAGGGTVKLMPAYVARARAALALGRTGDAEKDLARAAALYDAQRQNVASLPQRAALLRSARAVFEELVMLRLRGGRTEGALEALELGRVSFAPLARDRHSRGTLPDRSRKGITLDYAFVGDTVVTWVLDSTGLSVARSTVPRDSLGAALERVRVGVELQATEEILRPDLSRLYDWLVRPVEARLGPRPEPITIVADNELAEIPFAALFDSRRGRYVVESWPTQWAPSLRDLGRAAGPRGPVTSAVFVSNPAIDWRIFGALPPLSGAESETRAAAMNYPSPVLLHGVGADSAAVSQAMTRAEVFHFAGHAIYDDARPERSRLAVGPHGITANAIAALDLRRLRLAVLSACETMRVSDQRGSGFAGLMDAFLVAGTEGVIGSTWRVDDAATARLMKAFHAAYSTEASAAKSLRSAQLGMLRSPEAADRSPAAWAGLRYAGR